MVLCNAGWLQHLFMSLSYKEQGAEVLHISSFIESFNLDYFIENHESLSFLERGRLLHHLIQDSKIESVGTCQCGGPQEFLDRRERSPSASWHLEFSVLILLTKGH